MGKIRPLFFLACMPLFGQQYTISTLEAGGISWNNPSTLALDAGGNLYVSDWSGFIRKIWADKGSVTTVAGTGILGYGGDGGLATSAQIGKSITLALDSDGNLFFTDGDNNRVRRVDKTTGIITTVAGSGDASDGGDGGPAVAAGISQPAGILIDGAGNLYISNWTRIRMVSGRSGTIGTIAGGRFTGFSGDGGPALDAEFWLPVPGAIGAGGDLYVADYENSRIRKIAARSGTVTTVVGTGPCQVAPPPFEVTVCRGGYGGDGGPAAQARLNHASSMTVDGAGNMFIADTIGRRIRWVNAASGFIYTIAGNGAGGFTGDGGLATEAQIGSPTSIAVGASGKVFFTDEGNQRIRVLTPVGTAAGKLEIERRR